MLGSGSRDGAMQTAIAQAVQQSEMKGANPNAFTLGGASASPFTAAREQGPNTVMNNAVATRTGAQSVAHNAQQTADAAAMPPPAIPTLAHTVGGGVVGGAQAADDFALSRGALLGSPAGLAPTRLLFSPVTNAKIRAVRMGADSDDEDGGVMAHAYANPNTANTAFKGTAVKQGGADPLGPAEAWMSPSKAAAAAANQGPTYVRKAHSLASITDRIVAEFDEANCENNASAVQTEGGGSTAQWAGNVAVDTLAERLGVKRRRLYDVMNVLEACGVTERISKGACKWHGATRVNAVLGKILEEAPAVIAAAEEDGAAGDASSLKALACRLMQHVGSVPADTAIAFDACVAAMKLGGVPAPDAPGAHGTGALAGAARRLHDVASILIRIGVLEFVEQEGKTKGRGELKWLGAEQVTKRLAEGAAGAAVEKGYGTGAQQAALERAAAAAAAQHKSVLGQVPLDKKWDAANAQVPNNANAVKAASRLSSFFQRGAGGAPAPVPIPAVNFDVEVGKGSKKSKKGGQSVKFRQDVNAAPNSIFSPPMHGVAMNPRDTAAAAAALLRSPEWIAGLAQAASMQSPAVGAPNASAAAAASWANLDGQSPAFVAPLQALYSFYSTGAVGPKTIGGDRRTSGASEDLEGGMSLSGLSGLSPALFGASPAEVEATLSREVMQAAAQAAVQAAIAGMQPPDSVVRAKMEGRTTRAAATQEFAGR